jgi:hypothetical protein
MLDRLDPRDRPAVDRPRAAPHEGEGRLRRLRRGVLRVGGPHPQVRGRRVPGILEGAALVGEVPEVAVAAVDLARGGARGDPVLGEVGEQVLAAAELPVPPCRDHLEIGCQRRVGRLEADLVVALAGAAMGEGIAAEPSRRLHLRLGDRRPGDRGAEQVAAFVDRPGEQHREEVLLDEGRPQIEHLAGGGPGAEGLRLDARELLLALPDVRDDRHDLGVVVLAKPRDHRGGVEAARVGDGDLAGHGRGPEGLRRRDAPPFRRRRAGEASGHSGRAGDSPPDRRPPSGDRRSPRSRPPRHDGRGGSA